MKQKLHSNFFVTESQSDIVNKDLVQVEITLWGQNEEKEVERDTMTVTF